MERLPTFGLPEHLPVRSLIPYEIGDRTWYLMFPEQVELPEIVALRPTTMDMEMLKVWEVVADGVSVGWCWRAAGKNIRQYSNVLLTHSQAFRDYSIDDVLAGKFDVKYQLPHWQYLSYNGMCSVILISPDQTLIERLEG